MLKYLLSFLLHSNILGPHYVRHMFSQMMFSLFRKGVWVFRLSIIFNEVVRAKYTISQIEVIPISILLQSFCVLFDRWVAAHPKYCGYLIAILGINYQVNIYNPCTDGGYAYTMIFCLLPFFLPESMSHKCLAWCYSSRSSTVWKVSTWSTSIYISLEYDKKCFISRTQSELFFHLIVSLNQIHNISTI